MARGPCTFRQGDVTRALKGAVKAGIDVQRIEIDRTGKIVIAPGKPDGHPVGSTTSWEEALSRDNH